MVQINVYFVLFVCLYHVSFSHADFLSIKDKMYMNIKADYPCFLRLNGTNKVGCTSSRFGNVGTLHFVSNITDLKGLLNFGTAVPYIVALTPKMFTDQVLQSIELNTTKINGVVLLMNGTNREIIDADNLQTMGFTPEDTCPNRYSSSTSCPMSPWNPHGSSILLKGWSFPIFIIYDKETIKEMFNCFKKYNLPTNNQNDRSLCTVELKSHMYAAVDSKTCIRRTVMSYENIRPIKFCDPLGDKNVYWSLKELAASTPNKSVAIVAARLDATSMFQDLAPGALSTATSIVTLLATAKFISEILPYDEAKNYSNNIMFMLFNGEAYDYIGSSRVVYDMAKLNFPNDNVKLQLDNIGLFVELSQIHYDKEIVFHRPKKYNASENIQNFISIFQNNLAKDGFNIIESASSSIPPASIHSFLKADAQFPGLVLAGFEEQFKNLFYHSVMDDANSIEFTSADISNTLAKISTSLGSSLYSFVTNSTYNGNNNVDPEYIKKLLDCYVKSTNCTLFQSLTSLPLPDRPPNYYISIDLITNTITTLTRLLLSSFGSSKIESVLNEEDCNTYETKPGFSALWLKGNFYNGCYSTTSNYTDAISPAFIIPGYDLSSPRFSTWTESVWQEVQIRMFLRQSFQMQIIIFILGNFLFLLSFIITRKIYAQSDIYFTNQEVNSVTS
ncbi:nicastrin [Adelges cooleyi]|uniref:nicastrin n=1 Tax=Adelges cooleyi TaxID=133065 RepID=UPI0021807B32|nr:nicastrin [Adelges cooleyi]